jgi:hypothetical protein
MYSRPVPEKAKGARVPAENKNGRTFATPRSRVRASRRPPLLSSVSAGISAERSSPPFAGCRHLSLVLIPARFPLVGPNPVAFQERPIVPGEVQRAPRFVDGRGVPIVRLTARTVGRVTGVSAPPFPKAAAPAQDQEADAGHLTQPGFSTARRQDAASSGSPPSPARTPDTPA